MTLLQTKICTKCGIEKSLSEFHKNKDGRLGLAAACKKCKSIHHKNVRAKNPDKYNEKTKKWVELNPEKVKEGKQKWYKANRKKALKKIKEWQGKNPATLKKNSQDWLIKNPGYNRDWRKNHSARNNKNCREYMKHRRETDPKFKLSCNMRGAIGASLRGNKNGRHWEDLVGYTLDDLKKHLEKQFKDGMNWDNYGKNGWHIDHKIPISAFNFTKPEHRDFKRCWALSNLQSLWAIDNMVKHNKLTKHFQPSLLI